MIRVYIRNEDMPGHASMKITPHGARLPASCRPLFAFDTFQG